MTYEFIAFAPGYVVTVGTAKTSTITSYSREKHQAELSVKRRDDRGFDFEVLTGQNRGRRIELPYHACGAITTTVEKPAKTEGKAK